MALQTHLDPSPAALATSIDAVLDDVYLRGATATDTEPARPIVPTGIRRAQGEAIARVVASAGATRTLETGFAFGLSGLYMVKGALETAGGMGGYLPYHVALDPYQATHWGNAGRRLFARAGVDHLLEFHGARSEYALPRIAERGEPFDVGFVDGDHRFDATFVDVFYMRRIIRPGGIVLVDDTWLPSVRAVIDFFLSNGLLVEDQTASTRSGDMAVLNVPIGSDTRSWDHFVPFCSDPGGAPRHE